MLNSKRHILASLLLSGLFLSVAALSASSAPLPEPVAQDAPDFYCVACHTTPELLQALAVEEEEVESLSEGPG